MNALILTALLLSRADADCRRLCLGLDDDEFDAREAARTALTAKGVLAVPALRVTFADAKAGIDARRAAGLMLAPLIAAPRERAAAAVDAAFGLVDWPCLDALWLHYEKADAATGRPGLYYYDSAGDGDPSHKVWRDALFPYYVAARGEVLPWDGRPYARYRLATRAWVADCVVWGVPPAALRPLLAEMRRRDDAAGYGLKGKAAP